MNQHENEILRFLYTANIKNDLFIADESGGDKRSFRHYINLTGDYHEDDLIPYNDSIESLIERFDISDIRQQDEYVVHNDNFSFRNDRKYFFPKLNKIIEPVGLFIGQGVSVETYSEYLKNNFLNGPLFLKYNNRNIALVRENVTQEMKKDFLIQTDIFKKVINEYPEYRQMLKHIIYPVDVKFNQRTKRTKILEDVHASPNTSIDMGEYSPIYADSIKVYSFKKERYLTDEEFRIVSSNKYNPSLLDQMGLSVRYLENRDFIDSFTPTIKIDEYLRVEFETLYSKRYDNIFDSNHMSILSWGDNIFSDREIGFVVDDIQGLLDIMSNTIYKKWLNIIDCNYNAGFLSVFWKILYHQIFISRLSTIDTSAASDKHIREKFLKHGLSPDYENFLTEEEIIKIYLNIDKFMLNKGQKKVVDNFLKILKRKEQYPVIFNDINYGLFDKELSPRITSDHTIRDTIEVFDVKKKLTSQSGEIYEDNSPNKKEPYLFSVNDLSFEVNKKNNLRKLAEDTLVRYIKDSNSEYDINIRLEDKYLKNEIYAKPLELLVLSKFALLKSKNDPLVKFTEPVDERILTANIGSNQTVNSGDWVTIYSNLSTGNITSYKWKKIGGTGDRDIILDVDTETSTLTFTADTLNPGESDVTHIFELTLNADDTTTRSVSDRVTITVLAPSLPNRDPIANAGPDQVVISGSEVNLNGFKSRDPDGDVLIYSWARVDGTGNPNLSLSNIRSINPTFIADTLRVHDLPVTHIFRLTVTDSKGASSIDKVTITILPEENQPPQANAGQDDVVESGETYRLNGTATTDPNANISSFLWTRIGGNGDPLIQITDQDTARPTVTFEDVIYSTRTHIFRLTVIDSLGLSSTDTVTITVNTQNNPPIANAGENKIVLQGSEVQLTGSAVAGDGDITGYNWYSTHFPHTSITQDNLDPNCIFTAPTLSSGENSRRLIFWLVVYDSNGQNHQDSALITVLRENTPPIANAGQDRIVGPSKTVILNGIESSDPNRKPLTYHWEQRTSSTGRSVVIESDREAIASFVTEGLKPGEDPVTYIFALTVTDSFGDSHIDTVTITVDPDNSPPVANAGPDRTIVSSSELIVLDGTGSTDEDEITSYEWIQIDDKGRVNLHNSMTSQARFSRDISPNFDQVIHKFLLTVTNSEGISDTDIVTITVLPRNSPPVADAGDNRSVASGSSVILDGSGSLDRDGTIVTYSWEQIGSTSVNLINANTVNPIFTADTLSKTDSNITHQFRLTVTDTNNETDTDDVYITILAPENVLPVANAGQDREVNSGETVILDGTDSNDPDGSITSYLWTVSGTPGDITLQNENTAMASFIAPVVSAGSEAIIRTFVLTITDDDNISVTDTINITINPENRPPIANAGQDRIVRTGTRVQLDGSGSYDPDSDENLIYLWSQPSELTDDILTYRNIVNPEFTAPEVTVETVYIFQLSVTDNDGDTSTDNISITVRPVGQNIPPIANAGPDRDVASGSFVSLDGTESTDLDLDRLSYNWRRISGTGTNIELLNTDGRIASFRAESIPSSGNRVTHTFRLTVTDPSGETDSTTVTITVLPDQTESSGASLNLAPISNAGTDQTVNSGDLVQLDGYGYDFDFDPYIYNWRRSGGTSTRNVILSSFNVPDPTFTADILTLEDSAVTHEFTLTIIDIHGAEHEDVVVITINPPTNILPQADAGNNKVVKSDVLVTLDGSNSNDPDGDDSNLTYLWEIISETDITLTNKIHLKQHFNHPL